MCGGWSMSRAESTWGESTMVYRSPHIQALLYIQLLRTYIFMFEETQHLQLSKHPLTRYKVLEDIGHLFEGNSLSISGVCHWPEWRRQKLNETSFYKGLRFSSFSCLRNVFNRMCRCRWTMSLLWSSDFLTLAFAQLKTFETQLRHCHKIISDISMTCSPSPCLLCVDMGTFLVIGPSLFKCWNAKMKGLAGSQQVRAFALSTLQVCHLQRTFC